MTTAPASVRASGGSRRVLARLPSRPEAEFTRMKRAETAAAVLVRAQRISRSSGVRKMPPPVPVRPESNPRPAPMERAAGRDGQERKGPEEPPREIPGAPELPRANAGHENVEQQRGGFDHRRRQAEKGHDGDVAGRARVADGRVEERHQQNAGGQKGKLLGRH